MSNYNEIKLVQQYGNSSLNMFKIDYSEIVRQKHIIPIQYETINIGGNSDDLHRLSKKVDRYLLHIIEEIAEFLEETEKLDLDNKTVRLNLENNKDCLMELIDIIAYISSLLSILCIDYHGLEKIKKFNVICEDHITLNEKDFNVREFINDYLLKIEQILILDVRRQFPERKWHKDVDRILSIQELRELYDNCIDGVIKSLGISIVLFLYLTDRNCELFNDLFLKKNIEVYSLKN